MSIIEYDLSTDDSDDDALNLPGLASDGVPGLLVSVEFDDNLSDPVIENGKVRMPRGGDGWLPRPVEFGSGVITPISGLLQGMSFATGIGEIYAKNGEVYFPLAMYNVYYGTSYSDSNVAGAIVGITYATGLNGPQINNGLIELPMNNPLASFNNNTTAIAGAVASMYFQDGLSSIEANDGNVAIPRAYFVPNASFYTTGVTGGLHSVRYSADVTEPQIINGDMLLPAEGLLKGVYDINGDFHKWVDVQYYVGSQIPVAFTNLVVNGNYVLPLLLSIGFDGAGLRFFLSNSSPA